MSEPEAIESTVAPDESATPEPSPGVRDPARAAGRTRGRTGSGVGLRAVQRSAGNAAANALIGNARVQRHEDGAPHSHPHRFDPLPVGTDVIGIMDQAAGVVAQVRTMRPDARAVSEGVAATIADPQVITIWADDKIVVLDTNGTPVSISDVTHPPPVSTPPDNGHRAILMEPGSGRIWALGWVGGRPIAMASVLHLPNPSEDVDRGISWLAVLLPGFSIGADPALVEEIERRIAAASSAARRRRGPPGWARRRASEAAERQRERRRRRRSERDAPGARDGADEGTGTGVRGEGEGGGGEHETGVGTGDSGEGTGAALDASGEGRGGDQAAESEPTETEGGAGRVGEHSTPMSEAERRERVDTQLVMTGSGPAIKMSVDGAEGICRLREHESDASLDARLDALEQELGDSRDPNQSTRVQGGAAATSLGATPAGASAGRELTPEEAEHASGTGIGGGESGTPGPRVMGGGQANTPQWPSRLELYGYDTTRPVTLVTGASNQAAMIVDRGADVYNYFQRIEYRWELIDVSDFQPEDRARASETTGAGAGTEIQSGHGRDIERRSEHIQEDFEAEHWAVKVAALQLIAISAGVSMLGSLISSFVSMLTEPLNERSLAWGDPGEYLLRCIATPVSSDEAQADPEHHIIRASSVSFVPVRVANVNTLATELNDAELSEIERARSELAAAEADPARADEVAGLRARLRALETAQTEGATARIASTVEGIEQQVRWCEIIAAEPGDRLLDMAAICSRYGLDDDGYADLLQFKLGLTWQGLDARTVLGQMRTNLTKLRTQQRTANRWRREIGTDHRPRVTLVSEESGQAYQLITMLGEKASTVDDPNDHRWVFYDLTSDKTQQKYEGRSTKAGEEGRNEAIRNAFVEFRENAEYGRGTIAIRMPEELDDVPIESRMRAAPGATARWMGRLEDLATAAEVAALVVATAVTGGGALAFAIGAAGGVAGGVVASHRMLMRRSGERLSLDYETFLDILGIVGAVAAVLPGITGLVSNAARRAAGAAREAGDVGRFLRAARWAQRAEIVDRGLHIFGTLQGIGQTMIQIPFDVLRQFAQLQEEIDANPAGMSEGQIRARRAMILLNAFKSGTIGVISLGQSLGEEAPHVTSDAEIWSGASEVAGGPTREHAGDSAGTTTEVAGDASGIGETTDSTTGRPVEVDVDESGGSTRDTSGDPAALVDDGVVADDGARDHPATEAHDDDADATVDDDRVIGPTRRTSGASGGAAPHRSLDVGGLVAAIRRMMFADRSTAPPTGRIHVRDGASFAAATGLGPDAVAAIDPSNGSIVINAAVLDATPGLAARLERVVIGRGHPTGRRALGDLLGRTILNQVIRNVFGGHAGLPASSPHPLGQQVFELLAGAVGSGVLVDTYFQGTVGNVRDRLRERYGHSRTEAILDAARNGALGDLRHLLEPSSGGLAEAYGPAFTDAIADLVGRAPDSDVPRRATPEQRLVDAVADAVGSQPLRDAFFGGDSTHLDTALRTRLGGDEGAVQFIDRVRSGDTAGALTQLADSRAAPRSVPAEATASSAAFDRSLSGVDDGSAAGLLGDVGSFALIRELVEAGAVGGDHRDAARARLQEVRLSIVDGVLAEVRAGVHERFPGVRLELQDLGTPGFASDRDVTLVATSADPAVPVAPADLIRASTEAVRDAYGLARERGFDPSEALDTNFYTELHEDSVTPATEAERRQISADQTTTSITEIAINAPEQLGAARDAQLAAIDSASVPPEIAAEMRARVERQFATAERRAAELRGSDRETGLRRARERLEDALSRTPPPSARELRQLMADVKLLEPDAYGSRAAVEGVVHGQQAARRAQTPDELAAARSRMGTVESGGQPTMTEQIEHRLQQARASLGHLLGHLPRRGTTTPEQAAGIAKQLGRIAHAVVESGIMVDHPLLDDTGAVVASKAEQNPEAIVREIRVWAERTGQRFPSDQGLLDAYVAAARQLGLELTSRLGVNAESMRAFEGAAGDDGPPPTGSHGAGATDRDARSTDDAVTADRPVDPADTGAVAARIDDATPAADRTPHEIAHDELLERLHAEMATPIPAPETGGRPLGAGEVGRFRTPDAAYRAFRDAVARAGTREVALFFQRSTGRYVVKVGSESAVGPPEVGGPWECPIHTHPNPENVLTYRMPAPQDVFLYFQQAMRTGRVAVGMIEHPLPDGTRGQCRVEVHPNGDIVFEFPGQDGPEHLTFGDYQERWDSRSRYVDPDSAQYRRFLQDMADHHRQSTRDRDGFSSDAPAPTADRVDAPGELRRESSESEYAAREFFDEDRHPSIPQHNPRYNARSRLENGTMSMDFSLRDVNDETGAARRSGQLRGSEEFRAALAHFETAGQVVERVKGDWGAGDNLEFFTSRLAELLTDGVAPTDAQLIAASETHTGRWALEAGFGHIEIVQADETQVTVLFHRGASNLPATAGRPGTLVGASGN